MLDLSKRRRMSLLTTQDLSVALDGQPILTGVNFHIDAGEIVTILGPNGSGKSTFLRSLMGMIPPSSGLIRRKSGLRIGYVPQKLAIDRNLPLSVRRFLSLPTRVTDAQAREALERTGLPWDLRERPMAGLSGGQMQRVLLARALLARPHLLVLDEATQGLDQPGEAAFYRLIEHLRHEIGAAVLMVSHDLHVVMAASDRVICLNGHVCCEGTPRVVSNAPEYRALFGLGTQGALALYRHEHDHGHGEAEGPHLQGGGTCGHDHAHGSGCGHDHGTDFSAQISQALARAGRERNL